MKISAPSPLRPFTQAQLIAMWGGRTEPVVSIFCPTFNHQHYISAALDGFLGQVTDFPFEIIVRDDASTDGTADVIRSYAARYPAVFRPILEPSNTFSKGVSFIPPLLRAARGEFFAGCAGDDYWIDPRKLSLQVEALRRQPRASLCFHDVVTVRDALVVPGPQLPQNLPSLVAEAEFSIPSGWFPMPVTWVFRRSACDFEAPEFDRIINEDNLLLTQFGRSGPAICLREKMAAYRLHESSIYSARSERHQRLMRLNSFLWVSHFHFRTGSGRYGRRCAFAAACSAAGELKVFGPSVAVWSTLMLLRVLTLGAIDPGSRLRRRLRAAFHLAGSS